MTYNIHPIFVHFPIALLFLYSFFKIIPLEKFTPRISWKHITRVLLIFGVLGAFVAAQTGEIVEHLVQGDRNLVETHSLFANITIYIYTVLLIGELLELSKNYLNNKFRNPSLEKTLTSLKKFFNNRLVYTVLALTGLITLTVTGLLGGVIVYGTTADPLAPIVLKLLGLSIN